MIIHKFNVFHNLFYKPWSSLNYIGIFHNTYIFLCIYYVITGLSSLLSPFGVLIELRKASLHESLSKVQASHATKNQSKSMLAALHISCNESRKMGTKMCKLLNVLCKKVETASILDEDENYFTPSDDLEIEQHSLNSANDDDTPTLFCKICVEPSQNPWMTVSTSKAVPTFTALNALSSTSNRNLKIT